MNFPSFEAYLAWAKTGLKKGPHAVVLCEDATEIAFTVAHTLKCGFKSVTVIGEDLPRLGNDPRIKEVTQGFGTQREAIDMVNQVSDLIPGQWMFYCFNAEYLFYPFSETRTIGELLTFCTEERRDTVLTFTVDLYAKDLSDFPTGIDRASAHFDRSGYYATGRQDSFGNIQERQLDFHGGLRSRYEEFVPVQRRRIDRVAIFRAKPGLVVSPDHKLNDPEYNTYACPWHNSPTAALPSFRTAKALKRNPSSTFEIDNFQWHGSAPFNWQSQQLMEAGLMEPGQWF